MQVYADNAATTKMSRVAIDAMLPYFDIIGWDFAVDENGEPVCIEYNVMPEPNQISCGPTFGELSEEVFKDVFIDKNR